MDRIARLTIATVTALLAGCPADPPSAGTDTQAKRAAEPRPSVALRVLVVNEPELSEAINRLRGEWAERTGSELRTSAKPWQELIAEDAIDADLIAFPSRYLGELCVRNWLRPVRPNVLESDELRATDFFPLVRHDLIRWNGQVMALPLGIQLAETGAGVGPHPATSLLARAAPHAIAKQRLGVLFDSQSMQPRIAEPPFVDTLTQLVQSNNANASAPPARPVPVLGYSDRLIAVATSSRNAASAFRLLEWLAQPDASTQLARAGEGTLPVRQSLASSPLWHDPTLTASERIYLGETLKAALSQPECVLIPRIPGVDEYMAALDQAVREALTGEAAPQAALQKAAERWDAITDARGRDAQRRAYLKHLGISESDE